MKMFRSSAVCLALIAGLFCVQNSVIRAAQAGDSPATPADTDYRIVDRGPNSRTWQRETYEKTRDGNVAKHVHKYTELTTGMHVRNAAGGWTETSETINILPDGTAAATNGEHQAYFPGDIYDGAIHVVTADGKHLYSRPTVLCYVDGNRSVVLARLKSSAGQLVGQNKVVYTNAFDGLGADLSYSYTRAGFEQDVVLWEQPATPESFGLNPETTRLEMFTEFDGSTEPVIQAAPFTLNSGTQDNLRDNTLQFGKMKMLPGKAFISTGDSMLENSTVYKDWKHLQGRTFLIETLPFHNIKSSLTNLPTSASTKSRMSDTFLCKVSDTLQLPPERPLKSTSGAIRLAQSDFHQKQGMVLDYVALGSEVTNFTFQADTTYFLPAGHFFWVDGTVTIEGGAVIKFGSFDGSSGLSIDNYGTVVCAAKPYRPAVFTAKDDDSIGEWIDGSTGTPTNYYGQAIGFFSNGSISLHDLRLSYLQYGLNLYVSYTELYNIQAVDCNYPILVGWANIGIYNSLFYNVGGNAIASVGGSPSVSAMHVTAHNCNGFAGTPQLALVNSLMVNVTNLVSSDGTVTTNCTAVLSSDAGVFQVAGGGNHYLAAGSPYRGCGTTNIDSWLLSELALKTTHPPVVYFSQNDGSISNLVLHPQAPRETNGWLDLGYHYDPVDYILGPMSLTNATISIYGGARIGFFGSNTWTHGIVVGDNSKFTSHGTPDNLNYLFEYTAAQEAVPQGWQIPSAGLVSRSDGTNSSIDCRFTDWSVMAQDAYQVDSGNVSEPVSFKDCQFQGGLIRSEFTSISFTNCLLERVAAELYPDDGSISSFRNNTFWRGKFDFQPAVTNAVIADNLFDGTVLPTGESGVGIAYSGGHNAYVTNFDTLVKDTGDLILSNSPVYEDGLFGNYYLPVGSPLIDAGSVTADQVGLYEFTTQTNQIKETNSIVDIGYHYVAAGTNGEPVDSNTNGVPDYVEDTNGNGVINGGTNQSPEILTQPADQTVIVNTYIYFKVVANASGSVGYQWQHAGTNLSGEVYSVLVLPTVQLNESGIYTVVITNAYGAVTSAPALLTVCSPTLDAISNQVVNMGAGRQVISLSGISAGCDPFRVAGISAVSGNSNLVSSVSVNYTNLSTVGTLSYVPSSTATGTVTIYVTLQDTVNTNWINGNFGTTGELALDNTESGFPTNIVFLNNSIDGATYIFTNVDGSSLYWNQVSINPPETQVYSAFTITNGNYSFSYDMISIGVNYVTNGLFGLIIKSKGLIHSPGYADTAGIFNLSSAWSSSSDSSWTTASGSAAFGGLNQFTESFTITVVASPASVVIVAPTNQTLRARTNVVVTALATNSSASDPIGWVQFFAGTNSLGLAASSNGIFQINWRPPVAGTYVLTAMATNSSGLCAWSLPVTNWVTGLPSVQIATPANGQTFPASPTNIIVSASTTAYSGTVVTNVTFYNGTSILGTSMNGLSWSVTNLFTNGTYTISAKAIDNSGAVGISSNISFVVKPNNQPPVVSAGPNQTNYLSTNWVSLNGLVSDDGLPLGNKLIAWWTNLNGGTNVTFANSNLPATTARFWMTGTYELQLAASDSQFTTTDTTIITVLASNRQPVLSANPTQMVLLPALVSTNPLIKQWPLREVIDLGSDAAGIDYFPEANCLVASVNKDSQHTNNLELVATNGDRMQFSSASNLIDLIYITAVRDTLGGFRVGELFVNAGADGTILRVEPDGTIIGTNTYTDASGAIQSNAWVVITNQVTVTNQFGPIGVGFIRGGLWVDRTGIWGGDLIVSTDQGYVFRINAAGKTTLIAKISVGENYCGTTTIPNDSSKYGPWAGCVLVGGTFAFDPIISINTNGAVIPYYLGISAAAIRVIPQSEDFYGIMGAGDGKLHLSNTRSIWKVSSQNFVGMAGDILVAAWFSAQYTGPLIYGGELRTLHWDGTNFIISTLANGSDYVFYPNWVGANFAPVKILDSTPIGALQLNACITDDGEILSTTSNRWTVVSGPASVSLQDASLTNTIAEFSEPGQYLLQLSAFDGQYMVVTNVTVVVARNQPPGLSGLTNQTVVSDSAILAATVTDDGWPSNHINSVWSQVSGPQLATLSPPAGTNTTFQSTNFVAVNNVTFPVPGIYVFRLMVDDGQATNYADVTITYGTSSFMFTPAYGRATSTNVPFTLTATILDARNIPITNVLVTFLVTGGNETNWTGTNDVNGQLRFTYYNMNGTTMRDVITAIYNETNMSLPVYKDWAPTITCGTELLAQQVLCKEDLVGQSVTNTSREWTNVPAAYYAYEGVAGDVLHLALVQESGPFTAVIRDPSDHWIDSVAANYVLPGTRAAVDLPLTMTGEYIIEVVGVPTMSDYYDLILACDSQTNNMPGMQVVYNGTNVPNGGTVIFPATTTGVPTNIILSVTNTGTAPFAIWGFGTNGDFVLTNVIGGSAIVVNPGVTTNLGVKFGATVSGQNFGALVISTNIDGAGYTLYFEASAVVADVGPTVQFTSPADNAILLDSASIPFGVSAMPGGARISAVVIQLVTSNGILPIMHPEMSLLSGNSYTNSCSPNNWYADNVYYVDGDFTVTATAIDAIGRSNSAPPILIHIVSSANQNPAFAADMQVLLNGTNLVSGSMAVFPQTAPSHSTNLTLVITNSGTSLLWITNVELSGDFAISSNVFGSVPVGGTTNLVITFNASSEGTSVGELVLDNNASSIGKYILNLTGEALDWDDVASTTNATQPVAVNDSFRIQANSANNILYPLANDYDTNNYPLAISSVTSSEGGSVVIVNNGTAISYTPPRNIRSVTNNGVTLPADGFYYTVTDGHGGTARGTVSIIIDATDKPAATIVNPVSPWTTNAGATVPIVASVVPAENVVKVDYYLDGTFIGAVTNNGANVSGIYTFNWTAVFDNDGNQQHFIDAQATDRYGQMGEQGEIQIDVDNSGLTGSLLASIDSIVDKSGVTRLNSTNNLIRDGLFQLYGRAFHSLGSNVVWQLGVYTADGTLVRNLTPATTAAVGSATASNVLINCDLTTLMNGVYTLTLSASGGYQLAQASVPFRLESSLKVGQFGFSQQDLVIPVNGIPLTVTRTYNSINVDKGDFGYGWTYSLGNLDVELDETRDTATDLDGNQFSERTGGGRDVTLTLPDGRRTTFYFNFDGPYGVDSKYYAAWTSAPGVNYKLSALGNPFYDGLNGCWNNESGVGFDSFDFSGFNLTAQDGTVYVLSRPDLYTHYMLTESGTEDGYYIQAYGTPVLSQIKEPSGDAIAINADSVVYTSAVGATSQVVFERNSDNLITSVSDPNGLGGSGSSGYPAVKYEYDSSDNLISVMNLVDRSAGTYVTNSFCYTNVNFPHYITGIINADGTQVARNFYDDSGKLAAVQDADGNLTKFIHDLTNNMEVIIDRLGCTNTYVYDLRGNIIIQTNQAGQITTTAYDVNNNKTNETVFLNGQPYAVSSYGFDTNLNVMVASTDPLGHTNGFSYDQNGNLLTSTDSLGHTTVNVYDSNTGNLLSTTDALGNSTSYSYNGSELLETVNAVGTVSKNYYDASTGFVTGTSEQDASGAILSTNTFVYDSNGNRISSTTWRRVNGVWTGAATVSVYDALNRVVQTINPDGGTNTIVYNNIGKQAMTLDPLGNATSYTYDTQGRLVRTTYADGTTVKLAYDANGNRIQSFDQAGNETRYVYDALNRLVRTIYADNTTNATVYDGLGRVAQTVDARGTMTGFAYDQAGRRIAVTNAFGTTLAMVNTYGYDANGNQVVSADGLGRTTVAVFDALNRQVETIFPDNSKSYTGYDAVGRRVADTNQDGVVTLYGYDGSGRLIAVTNAMSQVTRYQYDEAGNEIAQIDALNRVNTFGYDGRGRRVSHSRADKNAEYYVYDLVGNEIANTNFSSDVILYQYDALNRLIGRSSIVHGSSIGIYQDNYDYTVTGRRSSWSNDVSFASFVYDNRDRLTQKTMTWNVASSSQLSGMLQYGYDADGNLVSTKSGYVNGVQLGYGYDALNRMTNVASHGRVIATYAYDGVGNLNGRWYDNGVTNVYQYDVENRLTNAVWYRGGTRLAGFAYQIKAGGARTNASETVNGVNQNFAWSYDNIYRLTNEVAGSLGSVGYQYDSVGNRTARNSDVIGVDTESSYTYDTNDELLATSKGSYGYDWNGNENSTPDKVSYSYDVLNRLISYSADYDGNDNRVSKQEDDPVYGQLKRYFLVDELNPSGYAQVVEEYHMSANLINNPVVLDRVYNWGLDLISQQQFNSNTLAPSVLSYYGYDGHGNVRFLMGTNGVVTDTYTYDACGTVIASSGSTPNNYLYCGQQYDADLGLYYNRARYLDVNTGRFMSADTFAGNNEDPLSLHKYLYVECDPVDNVDPSGLYSQSFGYVVEGKIRNQYAFEHGGQNVNRTGGPIGVGLNPSLKPDIWNKSSDPKTFGEIKPLTISGIAHGITQLNKYEMSLKGFGYVREKWPTGIYTDFVNFQPFFYFNVNGLILYTTIDPSLLVIPTGFGAARSLAQAQAAQLAKGAVTTLEDVVGKMGMRAEMASEAEIEDGVEEVALTEEL